MEGFGRDLVGALREVVSASHWQCVGAKETFRSGCTKLYSEDGEDIVLIRPEGDRFYAMDSTCPHEGGPLELGEIEDLGNGNLVLSCPWHDFDFSLKDGSSSSGLQNQVYEVRVFDGKVYVQDSECSVSRPLEDIQTPSVCMANPMFLLKTLERKLRKDRRKQKLLQIRLQKTHRLSVWKALSAAGQLRFFVLRIRRERSRILDPPWKERASHCATETPSGQIANWIQIYSLHSLRKARLKVPACTEATLTHRAQELWNSGKITEVGQSEPPAQPSRKADLTVVDPGRIKRGKGGTLASRIALLHSLANIEQWAIDLSWDIIGRFTTFRLPNGDRLPREFYTDFVKVAGDEAKHYMLLQKRLVELGCFFGALPVHNGLWQSAADTSHDLLARLAIVHMVHEARGLDIHPQTLNRFATQGDEASVKLLEIIYTDEITHVAAGLKWFTYICSKENRDCLSTFHELVPIYFRGYLKPPFNAAGRQSAGMTEEWYLPLVKPESEELRTP